LQYVKAIRLWTFAGASFIWVFEIVFTASSTAPVAVGEQAFRTIQAGFASS